MYWDTMQYVLLCHTEQWQAGFIDLLSALRCPFTAFRTRTDITTTIP